MIKRIYNKIRNLLKGITNEQLSLEANLAAGMQVGKNCYGLAGCTIDHGHCWLIAIGDDVVFAPQVYLLAHDTSTKRSLGSTKIGRIVIGDRCFIGARVLILPGVTIGANTIIGAGSVVSKSLPPNVVAVGNPAKVVSTIFEYESKLKTQFDQSYTLAGGITQDQKNEMKAALTAKNGFVK